ncbi:hypothetical protein [Dactylosporangium sp. CA-139066]|uniref:hypothetical protein n=1 Tax=Dactylosporangium sp. CA-139066 TaxID=3239930 RepID=UPI003D94DF23
MRIAARYNGPPGSGNGGYSAGLLAVSLSTSPVEVTLRLPPPLDTDISVVSDGSGVARAVAGEDLIAEARPAPGQRPEPVPPVSEAEAREAAKRYAGFADHPFPTCYVCGPARSDGLGLFPGVLPDGRTAAPWSVPADVSEVTMWAALDCPGGWSVIAPNGGRPYVLGRLAVWLDALPSPSDECVVMGRHLASAGRKADVLSTVYSPQGTVLATARATWIALPS